jgi:hypothetical protein
MSVVDTPYLASIGMLDSEDVEGRTPGGAMAAPAADGTPSLLGALQSQYGLMLEESQAISSRELERKQEEVREMEERTGATLARMEDERALLQHTHSQEMENQRATTALALQTLQQELEALRAMHARELASVRRQAVDEHARLKAWCAAQLRAVEDNRDALLGQLAERRETSVAASGVQLSRLQAEHREQQSVLRKLLDEESERCASARAEVLAVTIAAGNERVALHAALATARRRAAAAVAESQQSALSSREDSAEHERLLRTELKQAHRRLEEQAAASARTLAEAAQRGEAVANALRREVASLTTALEEAHAARAMRGRGAWVNAKPRMEQGRQPAIAPDTGAARHGRHQHPAHLGDPRRLPSQKDPAPRRAPLLGTVSNANDLPKRAGPAGGGAGGRPAEGGTRAGVKSATRTAGRTGMGAAGRTSISRAPR